MAAALVMGRNGHLTQRCIAETETRGMGAWRLLGLRCNNHRCARLRGRRWGVTSDPEGRTLKRCATNPRPAATNQHQMQRTPLSPQAHHNFDVTGLDHALVQYHPGSPVRQTHMATRHFLTRRLASGSRSYTHICTRQAYTGSTSAHASASHSSLATVLNPHPDALSRHE